MWKHWYFQAKLCSITVYCFRNGLSMLFWLEGKSWFSRFPPKKFYNINYWLGSIFPPRWRGEGKDYVIGLYHLHKGAWASLKCRFGECGHLLRRWNVYRIGCIVHSLPEYLSPVYICSPTRYSFPTGLMFEFVEPTQFFCQRSVNFKIKFHLITKTDVEGWSDVYVYLVRFNTH